MTVKRLPHLQSGRLETILLPVLVSAATATASTAGKSMARPAGEGDSKKMKIKNNSDNIKGNLSLE